LVLGKVEEQVVESEEGPILSDPYRHHTWLTAAKWAYHYQWTWFPNLFEQGLPFFTQFWAWRKSLVSTRAWRKSPITFLQFLTKRSFLSKTFVTPKLLSSRRRSFWYTGTSKSD